MKKLRPYLIVWIVFGFAYYLLATGGGFVRPGGPYISFKRTIYPSALLLLIIGTMIYPYWRASTVQRIFRLVHIGLALALLLLIWIDVWAMLQDPRLRGALFGP